MTVKLNKFLLLCGLATVAFAADGLRVGASRVDITPSQAELPAPYKTIYQKIYVRTILVDNGPQEGAARAAIVIADVPMIQAAVYNDLVQQISRDSGASASSVVLGGTHTHNSIRVDPSNQGGIITGSATFVAKVKEAVVQSVREAKAGMQPARVGFGKGKAYIATNRNQWSQEQQRYTVGADRTGREPFDNTLSVVKFESLTGVPLAFLVNYGLEPVVNSSLNTEISGDVPGAVAAYVESQYGGKAVLAFTIGAAGDPLYSAQRTRRSPGRVTPASAHDLMSAMATLVGEEILSVSDGIQHTSQQVSINGLQKVLACPGKITTPLNLPSSCANDPNSKLPPCRDYKDQDTEAVEVRLGLLKIGELALVHADANVTPALGLRLMQASPLAQTIFLALNFGPARFIVDDAAYPLFTYEATASRLKQGCGEKSLLNGMLDLMGQLNSSH